MSIQNLISPFDTIPLGNEANNQIISDTTKNIFIKLIENTGNNVLMKKCEVTLSNYKKLKPSLEKLNDLILF